MSEPYEDRQVGGLWRLTGEKGSGWVRWTPDKSRSPVWEYLAEAIADFRAPCENAGPSCELWLKEEALDEFPETVTWVLFDEGVVQGFFAICSSTFSMALPASGGGAPQTVTKPCVKVVWICRRDKEEGGSVPGAALFRQALYQAKEMGGDGNLLLLVEPFNEWMATLLKLHYPQLRDADQGQLWMPLDLENGFPSPDAQR